MYESVMWVVAGLIVGWLAGSAMKGGGYGFVGDIAVAAIGALAGVWLVTFVVPEADRGGLLGPAIGGAVAAVLFVVAARLLTKRTGPPRTPASPKPPASDSAATPVG
ncbi:MAG: GlsB/YeaQ/YmgE family stress response membrane protein [Chloroflexota bacterium]